jgi:hypothetical protein
LRQGLAVVNGIAQVVLSVFLTFFIFRDGEALGERMNSAITRIAGERGRHLLTLAGNTVRGVVYGIIGTGMAQGGMAGIGYAIAGVPGAALLGPADILPPRSCPSARRSSGFRLHLALQHQRQRVGNLHADLGLAVSSIDNVLKPWLISQGAKLPFIVIFIGVPGRRAWRSACSESSWANAAGGLRIEWLWNGQIRRKKSLIAEKI